jgi:hypothetical protein
MQRERIRIGAVVVLARVARIRSSTNSTASIAISLAGEPPVAGLPLRYLRWWMPHRPLRDPPVVGCLPERRQHTPSPPSVREPLWPHGVLQHMPRDAIR